MATGLIYKCPTCKGELKWTPSRNKWVCEYCDGEFELEDLEAKGLAGTTTQVSNTNMIHREIDEDERDSVVAEDGTGATDVVAYTCSHCGAEIITSRNTAAMTCVYCGYPMIMGDQFDGEYLPKGVVPFKVEEIEATKKFKEFINKPLTPKKFLDLVDVQKIQGVYAPFWLYSGTAEGVYNAEGKKVGDWHNNKREIKVYDCGRKYRLKYKNIPVDASKRIDNDAMDSIEPFDLTELKPFNVGYLAGYLAEKWDDDKETCYKRAEPRIQETGENVAREDLGKEYDSVTAKVGNTCTIHNTNTEYVLLPTYLLMAKYADKEYTFAMNGQTGKFIGNLPIDPLKCLLFGAIGAIVGGLLGYFII